MKKAFTTAELLISLIVIGAISMLVIPTIVKDYNMRIRAAAIKDTYANVMAAVERACAEKNVTYFSQTGYMNNANIGEFVEKYIRQVKNNNAFAASTSYNRITGTASATDRPVACANNCYTMKGGAALKITCNNESQCTFNIDTNGAAAPNRGGVDMFTFFIGVDNNYPIIPSEHTSRVCRSRADGVNCINQLLINDWNLEKLSTETSAPKW